VNHDTAQASINPQRKLRTLAELPGPRALPVLGNFHQLKKGAAHLSIEAWSRQFGGCFRLSLGGQQMLVVSDPGMVGTLLRDRPDGFHRMRALEALFGEMGFLGVFAANGEAWRRQRKMVAAAFDPRHIKAYFPSLDRVTGRLCRRWGDHAAHGTEFDLQAELMRYTVDVVAGLAFGAAINTIESDRETIQTHLNVVFPMLNRRLYSPIRYWHWVKLPSDRKLDFHLSEVHRAVHGLIEQARARIAQNPELREAPSNLLEAMLAQRDVPGTELTDYDVASNVVTILLAGEDTTANTLAWLIYLVSRSPTVMRRLAQEADELLGGARWAGRLDQATSHGYLTACTQETMRMKPVAPFLISEAVAPTAIGDVSVPAGTVVMTLLRSASRDGRYFERPEVFDPERWLGSRGAAGGMPASGAQGHERVSMPFGAGSRICPGRNLALLEISIVTSMFFHNFEIKSLRTPDGGDVKELLSFAMAPSKMLLTLAARRFA
jgi:cytochrome P450